MEDDASAHSVHSSDLERLIRYDRSEGVTGGGFKEKEVTHFSSVITMREQKRNANADCLYRNRNEL